MIVDLRSDTFTKPTSAMRAAMAGAEVGDDVWGDDPTAAALEVRAAELLGKEAALFVPSGTMANQIALLLHCRPGDEVIVGRGAHTRLYESGAGAAWAGVQFAEVGGADGTFAADDVDAAALPDDRNLPHTRLVAVENTHNRGGGRVWPRDQLAAVVARARGRGLALHLDGARIWNAAVASGIPERELAAPFDTVSACFSKGLGAPVGACLAGSRELSARAASVKCWGAACARSASCAPPRCTRSSTTAPGSQTITRTRAASPTGWRPSRAWGSIRTRSTPTS